MAFRLSDLVEAGEGIGAGPAEHQDVGIGEAQPVRCLTRGLWLRERGDVRFAAVLDVREGGRAVRARLEIAIGPGEIPARVAAQIVNQLRTRAESGACRRGKILVLEGAHDDLDVSPAGLRVEQAAAVRRADIVLPEETLALIERNTLGFAQRAEQLARLGVSAREGVLLYGPPGTGETLVVRWLAGALVGHTKLIVTAGHYALLAETIEIARALQAALIVLEDVDLVGEHRDGPWAGGGSTLNLLRNEMDGLAPEARMLFVLATIRPEVLEPALAARPGRVDPVIDVGLPGATKRRLLVNRYAGGLRFTEGLAAATAARIGPPSPAFIKELIRRAVHAMLEPGGDEALEARESPPTGHRREPILAIDRCQDSAANLSPLDAGVQLGVLVPKLRALGLEEGHAIVRCHCDGEGRGSAFLAPCKGRCGIMCRRLVAPTTSKRRRSSARRLIRPSRTSPGSGAARSATEARSGPADCRPTKSMRPSRCAPGNSAILSPDRP